VSVPRKRHDSNFDSDSDEAKRIEKSSPSHTVSSDKPKSSKMQSNYSFSLLNQEDYIPPSSPLSTSQEKAQEDLVSLPLPEWTGTLDNWRGANGTRKVVSHCKCSLILDDEAKTKMTTSHFAYRVGTICLAT
jgi:hypothetical protein